LRIRFFVLVALALVGAAPAGAQPAIGTVNVRQFLNSFGGAMPTTGGASGFQSRNGTLVPGTLDRYGALLVNATGSAVQLRGGDGLSLARVTPQGALMVTVANAQTAASSVGLTGVLAPKQAGLMGGVGSLGHLTPYVRCDQSVPISTAASGLTQLVPLLSGRAIDVCGYVVVGTTAVNIKFSYGTGSACGTGTTDLTGALPVAANGGAVAPLGLAPWFTAPLGQALCISLSGAVQTSGHLTYRQL